MRTSVFLLLSLMILLAACTNKALYETAQLNRRQYCETLPEQQLDDCLAAHSETFEDFQAKREELLEKEKISPQ